MRVLPALRAALVGSAAALALTAAAAAGPAMAVNVGPASPPPTHLWPLKECPPDYIYIPGVGCINPGGPCVGQCGGSGTASSGLYDVRIAGL